MTDRSSVALRVVGSRATLLGAKNSLEAINTYELDDGALCFVSAVAERFGLHRASTAVPDGATIIKPAAGPGRWILEQSGGGGLVIPFPVSDIDATGIPNGKLIVAAGGLATWADLPTAFQITSFNTSTPQLLEVGATLTHPAFTASYNRSPTLVILTDTLGNSNNESSSPTIFSSTAVVTKTVYGQSATFTNTASDTGGTAAASIQFTWGELVHWGAVIDPGTYNGAFIAALSNQNLQLGAAGNFAFNALSGQSCFFAALSSFGLTVSNFFVGAFPFACSKVASAISLTNGNGITETYDIFRSDNSGLGGFTATVTS